MGREHSGRTGERQLALLVHFGLRSDSRVLEIGCGIGRLVYALAPYLDEGSYAGFDIKPAAIRWLDANYAPLLPNFEFRLHDVHNARYRPVKQKPLTWRARVRRARRRGFVLTAKVLAYKVLTAGRRRRPAEPAPRRPSDVERTRWPYADESFDLACAFSVFTHMRLAEVAHYLAELRRVLTPGGRGVMTFFAIGAADASPHLGWDPFVPLGDGVSYTTTPELPERAIAFDEGAIRQAIADAGLVVVDVVPGRWRGPVDTLDVAIHKDVFVVERP